MQLICELTVNKYVRTIQLCTMVSFNYSGIGTTRAVESELGLVKSRMPALFSMKRLVYIINPLS